MLPQVISIRGSLAPEELPIAAATTVLRISFGQSNNVGKSLQGVQLGKHTVLEIDSVIKTDDGRYSASKFLEALNVFIKSDDVETLQLQGTFLIHIEEDEPVTVRVKVADGKVRYQEARLVWESELIV